MTPTPAIRTSSHRRHLPRALLAGTLLAVGLAAAQPAVAADPPHQPEHQQIRTCDESACLVAWAVLDSDHDGVSDGDERAAGTDPYDANSRPPMQHLADLMVARELPSFEAGRATFLAIPAEIMAMRGHEADNPLDAFPLGGRKDALSRLGISAETMAAAGVDPSRTGFSLGLDHPSKDGVPAAIRVAATRISLVSAGGGAFGGLVSPFGNGGVASIEHSSGPTVTTMRDGTVETFTSDGHGHAAGTITFPGSDSPDVNFTQTTTTSVDNDTTTVTTHRENRHPETNELVSDVTHVHDSNAAGITVDVHKVVVPVKDENGTVTGTTVTTDVTVRDNGKVIAQGTQTQTCDAKGENCGYYNPDAEDGSVLTPEMIVVFEGKLGSTIRTVEGWTPPVVDGDAKDPNDPGVIMLIDPEAALEALVISPLRVTTAQPEVDPDHPRPGQNGPIGGGQEGCSRGQC
jgi:hypothetical protein